MMDLLNLAIFWFICGLFLMICNFLLFRFALVRKIIYVFSAIVLIGCGFTVGDLMVEHSFYIGGSTLSWDNSDIDILVVANTVMLIMLLLMSFGDSLLDFEDSVEYSADGWEFLGTYYLNVSEKTVSTPSFFGYYMTATVISLIVFYVLFYWLEWVYIFAILGLAALTYTFVLKPLYIKLMTRKRKRR